MDILGRCRPGDRVLFRVGHAPRWIRGTIVRTESGLVGDDGVATRIEVAERLADGSIVRPGVWPFDNWDEERIKPDMEIEPEMG